MNSTVSNSISIFSLRLFQIVIGKQRFLTHFSHTTTPIIKIGCCASSERDHARKHVEASNEGCRRVIVLITYLLRLCGYREMHADRYDLWSRLENDISHGVWNQMHALISASGRQSWGCSAMVGIMEHLPVISIMERIKATRKIRLSTLWYWSESTTKRECASAEATFSNPTTCRRKCEQI